MSGIGDTGPLLMPGDMAEEEGTARLSSVPDLLPPEAVIGRASPPAAAEAAVTAVMEAVLAPMPPPPAAAAASDSHTESMEELVAKRSPIDSHVWKCACGGSIGCFDQMEFTFMSSVIEVTTHKLTLYSDQV